MKVFIDKLRQVLRLKMKNQPQMPFSPTLISGVEPVEVEVKSWDELVAMFLNPQLESWVFRGLARYSYSPISSLERTLRHEQHGDLHRYENSGVAHLKSVRE